MGATVYLVVSDDANGIPVSLYPDVGYSSFRETLHLCDDVFDVVYDAPDPVYKISNKKAFLAYDSELLEGETQDLKEVVTEWMDRGRRFGKTYSFYFVVN